MVTSEARSTCYRCHKPTLTCICSTVRRVDNRTPIWVAQHLRERFHPLGTARIARLGLARVHVEVVTPGDAQPASLPEGAALLYPGPDARELTPAGDWPQALVVIDGTWPQAKSLYRKCHWLSSLPRVRLTPRALSRYRLRREPAPHCVSTIEAIVEALRRIEPETALLDGLLDTFDAMIDQQIALTAAHGGDAPRPPMVPGPLRDLVAARDRVVVVAAAPALRPTHGEEPPIVAHLAAWRWGDGACLERFVRPPPHRMPNGCHLAHIALSRAQLEAGSTAEALEVDWRNLVAPNDVVVAWSNATLEVLRETLPMPSRQMTLKAHVRRLSSGARGPLSEQLDALSAPPPPRLALSGRAGHEVMQLAALLEVVASRCCDRRYRAS